METLFESIDVGCMALFATDDITEHYLVTFEKLD